MTLLAFTLSTLPWLIFIQGILLAAMVFGKRQYFSNRYLSALLLALATHGLISAVWSQRGIDGLPELYVAFSCLPFIYGPLMYRYVWHSLYQDWRDPVPFWLHSLPALINLVLYGALFLYLGRIGFVDITFQVLDGNAPWYVQLVETAKVASGIGYTSLILLLVRKHWQALRKWREQPTRRRWLNALLWVFLANWLLVLVNLIAVNVWQGIAAISTAAQLIAFLAFLYVVTFFAVRYPVILEFTAVRDAIREKLNLDDAFINETLKRLAKAEQASFYLEDSVSLTSLAKKLGLHANALSFILNDQKGTSFRDYINNLRLDHFLRLSAQDASGTQLERALEAGFASKSTFLRAFKKRFDCTPQAYFADQSRH